MSFGSTFPKYQVRIRKIGGKLLYLTEADVPNVQPRFAQAQTAERLRAKLHALIRPLISAAEPSIPRVYDALYISFR
jgi:hypothetical protein